MILALVKLSTSTRRNSLKLTVLDLFTRWYKIDNFCLPRLEGENIELSTEAKCMDNLQISKLYSEINTK